MLRACAASEHIEVVGEEGRDVLLTIEVCLEAG